MNRPPMLDLDTARERLLAQAQPIGQTERVATLDADGRTLAADVVSGLDVPAADNAQMDGYAVSSRALQQAAEGDWFDVSQRIAAGHEGGPLQPGTVARIFTGAPMPQGADAVVMQEQAEVAGDGMPGGAGSGAPSRVGTGARVRFLHRPATGEWVRRTGEDIRAGSVILPAGARLGPQALGLAASVGAAHLQVHRRPRVACFFTGDELAMPGEPLRPGAIYNSNRFLLRGLLQRLGCEVDDLGIVGDDLAGTRAALRRAAATADLIVTSGGMSVGEEDHVKPAVEAEGELDLWQIAMKPGKPLAYGRIRRETAGANSGFAHFIGLPGNPVSSFVTFLILVRPFLLRLGGARDVATRSLRLVAGFDWPRPDRRREFLRVSIAEDGRLALFPNQGSAVLTSTVVGDGLVDNPAGRAIAAGDVVTYLPFADLIN